VQLTRRQAERLRPLVQAALSAYLAGGGDVGELARLARFHGALLEECLAECLRSVTGEAQAAAARVVVAMGLLERWRRAVGTRRPAARQRALVRLALLPAELRNDVVVQALHDPDDGVRRTAVRALVPTATRDRRGHTVVAVRSLTERRCDDELRRHGASPRIAAALECGGRSDRGDAEMIEPAAVVSPSRYSGRTPGVRAAAVHGPAAGGGLVDYQHHRPTPIRVRAATDSGQRARRARRRGRQEHDAGGGERTRRWGTRAAPARGGAAAREASDRWRAVDGQALTAAPGGRHDGLDSSWQSLATY
jgi:hypothetical protein